MPAGATLTITGTGILKATSTGSGAAIGGHDGYAGGNITIKSGTIITTSGGQGGGNACAGGNITINGGAGIGGTDGACNITILGGTVTAIRGPGSGLTDISGGYDQNTIGIGPVIISGGSLKMAEERTSTSTR